MPAIYSNQQLAAHYLQSGPNSDEAAFLQQFTQSVSGFANDKPPHDPLQGLHRNLTAISENLDEYAKETDAEKARTLYQDTVKYFGFVQQYLHSIKQLYPEAYGQMAEHINRLETQTLDRGDLILSGIGETKTAAHWIEQFKLEAKKGQPVKADTIAKIFAARELSNAVRGVRYNIDHTHLTEEQILAKAEQIKKSPVFQEYLKANAITPQMVRERGHGGKLEMAYDEFIKSRQDCQDLDPRLYGRHQFRFDSKTYAEFLQKNAWTQEQYDRATPDERAMQAARMLAASEMTRVRPLPAFNEKNLNRNAASLIASPGFRLARRDPALLQQAACGDLTAFQQEVGRLHSSFDAEGYRPPVKTIQALRDRMGGHVSLTPEEKNKLAQDPRYAAAKQRRDERSKALMDYHEGLTKNDLLLAEITRTDKQIKKDKGSISSLVRDGINKRNQKREQWEQTWTQAKQKILGLDGLSDAEKRQEIEALDEKREEHLRRGQEINKRTDELLDKLDEATAAQKKAVSAIGANEDVGKIYEKTEREFLNKRSSSYRKMFRAVSEYNMSAQSRDTTSEDLMNAVASILEYQDGKERRGGDIRERVDQSMQMLVNITAGTPYEKFAEQQIRKLNEARGLRPGQRGYLTKETLKTDEAPAVNLYDKIKQFSFIGPDDEDLSLDYGEAGADVINGDEGPKEPEGEPEEEKKEEPKKEDPDDKYYGPEFNFI